MKILHLHLRDSMGNPKSLTCHLEDGAIIYKAWSGHGSSGRRLCVNDVCPLYKQFFPVDNPDNLSVDEFRDSIIKMWDKWKDTDHGPKIEGVVQTNVIFER